MYKYTYIQAAGDKRITKRHKVCLLTIAGGTGEKSPQRSPPCYNQADAAGRSTTPTTGARERTRKGWRCSSGWRLAVLLVLLVLLARYLPAIFNGIARLV